MPPSLERALRHWELLRRKAHDAVIMSVVILLFRPMS